MKKIVEIGFDGYAVGGLSVGESKEEMYKVTHYIAPKMPHEKTTLPYGCWRSFADLLEGIEAGIDMFDLCNAYPKCKKWNAVYFSW